MAQDLFLAKNEDGFFDLSVTDGDFTSTDGLFTSFQVSILTDARADAGSVPDPINRRGWIGDILTAGIARSLGSVLWLYSQSRLTTEILNRVQQDARNSLLWIIEDRIARSVSVIVNRLNLREFEVNINIITNEGKEEQYTVLWRLTSGN